jgi:tetratricopeptide (TPR) repeat protein
MATASVRASPRSYKTHEWLASALYKSDPSHRNIDRVIEESEESRALLDPLPDERKPDLTYVFASSCYVARKDYPKAIAVLNQFIAIEKTFSPSHTRDVRQAYAYLLLSTAYLTTGDKNRALDAAERSRALDPFNPKIYLQMTEIAATSGRMDDAFVRLTEGEFVTSDENLMHALVELYQRALDPRSCVLLPGPNGPEMNPACGIVHEYVCAASPYVVKTLRAAGQEDAARTRESMFVEQFGCPKGPLASP